MGSVNSSGYNNTEKQTAKGILQFSEKQERIREVRSRSNDEEADKVIYTMLNDRREWKYENTALTESKLSRPDDD